VPDEAFVTGPMTLTSDEVEREYYLKLPSPYNSEISYPLILAFHGFTGDYTNFTEGYYDLQEAVGDEAILVYPNALEINGETQWDHEADLGFFDDLYAELEANLCFDKRKVFAVGHSNGAGFSHTLGCRRGDVLRAIGPVSGIFLEDYEDKACIGQVASIVMHGDNDTIIPKELALPGRDYWVAINSCSTEASETTQGVDPSCAAYTYCDPPEYPVQYCEYSGKHDWPDFGGEAIWDFFKGLVPAIPSSTPGTGEPPPLAKGFANIKIMFSLDFVGTPDMISLGLYASGLTLPPVSSPKYIITPYGFPAGEYTPGQVKEYNDVAIVLRGVEPGDYAFLVAVYVEGGVYPIPTDEKDYMGFQEITIDSSTINIETPFELELLVYE
jgi:poly(3-hydroxybutyrate) depolymerase